MSNKNKSKNIVNSNATATLKQENLFEGKIAVCKMDNQIADLVKFNTFHNLHKKLIKLLLSSFLVLLGGIFALSQKNVEIAVIFFVATPLFPIVLVLIQRASLRAQLQKDFEFAKTTISYEFSENEFFVITKFGKRVSSVLVDYCKLDNCYETTECFYIYISQGNAFVLRKDRFEFGDMDNFKRFLKKKLEKKYKATTGQKLTDKKKGSN